MNVSGSGVYTLKKCLISISPSLSLNDILDAFVLLFEHVMSQHTSKVFRPLLQLFSKYLLGEKKKECLEAGTQLRKEGCAVPE